VPKRVESWVVTDEFWQRVEPLVPTRVSKQVRSYVRKPGAGRPPKPARQVFEAVVYVLRTGCQWKALPKERFGSSSAVHKRFLEWEQAGFFEELWKAGLAEYDDMEGIAQFRQRGPELVGRLRLLRPEGDGRPAAAQRNQRMHRPGGRQIERKAHAPGRCLRGIGSPAIAADRQRHDRNLAVRQGQRHFYQAIEALRAVGRLRVVGHGSGLQQADTIEGRLRRGRSDRRGRPW